MAILPYPRAVHAAKQLQDGTHRTRTLDETWRAFGRLAPRAGITRLAELTGLDTLGIPVFAAIRPMGKSLSTQQGKGTSPLAAKVSALMESLETFSAESIIAPIVHGSYHALRARRTVVDVRRLARAKPRLDLRARWPWLLGQDLDGADVLVPRDAVTLDCTFRTPPVFDISSNGLASGNVRVEAIVHGLLEVIERDAEAAWRRAGGDRRLVLDTITDRSCLVLIERIVRAGSRVVVWDLTSELGIPVIGCAIVEDPREPAWRPLGVYQGFGAHLCPEIAIARAITEAAQTRLTYIAGGRDDFFPEDYARATDPALCAALWARVTSPCDEPVAFDDLPATRTADLHDDLAALRIALDDRDVIVVDLTHPTLGVPVVKVIVPGLATDVNVMG